MSELVTCKDLTKRFGNHTALDHLNLSLDSGKIIGLLGPNGSGKTTLIKLLLGFYDPNKGNIKIGDLSLKNMNPHVWRAHTGLSFRIRLQRISLLVRK